LLPGEFMRQLAATLALVLLMPATVRAAGGPDLAVSGRW
jgi:hypothetical protein